MWARISLLVLILAGAGLLFAEGVGEHLIESNAPTSSTSPLPSSATPEFVFSLGVPELPEGWNLCTNTVHRYVIGYPKGWYTAHISSDQTCQWFDPYPFQIVQGTEGPFTALEAYPAKVAFTEALSGLTDPVVARILLREDILVGDRRATRLEIESTGTGPHPKGTKTYAYIIDLGESGIFVVATTNLATTDYVTNKPVVDMAVKTLRFL